jgi:hypothetical protein
MSALVMNSTGGYRALTLPLSHSSMSLTSTSPPTTVETLNGLPLVMLTEHSEGCKHPTNHVLS